MGQFLSFARKEFIHILRDPRSLLILLVMPQIMVVVLGCIIKNEVDDIRVGFLDGSHDYCSERLTRRICSNKHFIGRGEIGTEAEAAELFKKGEIDLVVVYGSDFANQMLHSGVAKLQLLSDGSEPNQASVRVAYARQIIADFQRDMFSEMGGGQKASDHFEINVVSRMLFNPQQRSELNFVPGVVGVVILLICCMMTSIAIVREHETGTMEILLASPLPSIYVVMAKLVPYLIISLLDMATILCISYYGMGVPMAGSLAVYVVTASVYILTSLMLGLLISTVVSTQLAAMLLSLLLIVPTIYLSGMVFAIESMPAAAQALSNIVPAKWFISASRKIMIEGVGVEHVATEIAALAAEGLAFMLLAWRFFRTRLA